MMENIENSLGLYASQNLMIKLIEKGMNRESAYNLVQQLSFKAVEERKNLSLIAQQNRVVRKYLNQNETEKIFDLKWFLRNIL